MDDRYNTGAKSLNTSGGSNRFKFESKKSRARRVDVDVTHKVRAEGYLDADSTQELDVHVGSFFQQELDRCKELNATPPFKRFYYKVSHLEHAPVSSSSRLTVKPTSCIIEQSWCYIPLLISGTYLPS